MQEDSLMRMKQERNNFLERILGSSASHKLIIAGPGTGKTYTFGRLLEINPGTNLVITLINNLVDEMKDDLNGLADVRTFHSFSTKILYEYPFGGLTKSFLIYPNLDKIISSDSLILFSSGDITNSYSENDFGTSFRLLDQNCGVDFFLELSNYYNAVGFDDSVFRVFLLFDSFDQYIPNYHYVMVDEYQDFNPLEVGLLSKLEDKSFTLIVGDDDQSIYQFRQASSEYIRNKALDKKYVRFSLPYSTRCTSVIISAVEQIIFRSQSLGLLDGRLEKEFKCYLPKKQGDNESYPKIKKVKCSVQRRNAPYISRYIAQIISNVPKREILLSKVNNYPLALIVGQKHYLNSIEDYLSQHFNGVKKLISQNNPVSVLDGYKYLIERENSNLGWRILLEIFKPENYEECIVRMFRDKTPLIQLLDYGFVEYQNQILNTIQKVLINPAIVSDCDKKELEEISNNSVEEIRQYFNCPDVEESNFSSDLDDLEPEIILTNFNGCKGLSAGYTFITGLDKGVFPMNTIPTEAEICQYIVAITRTRKQCHLIHTKYFLHYENNPSTFFHWIPNRISDTIYVNKNFFCRNAIS